MNCPECDNTHPAEFCTEAAILEEYRRYWPEPQLDTLVRIRNYRQGVRLWQLGGLDALSLFGLFIDHEYPSHKNARTSH